MGKFKEQKIRATEPHQPVCLHHLAAQNLGVFCWCNRCSHNADLPVDILIERLGSLFPVPELGIYLRCSNCGAHDVAARPAWPHYGGQIARHG
ncbi:MAG: hypothetical protein ACPHCL_00765 [Candidatus Puniceispirillaceae bacterium]